VYISLPRDCQVYISLPRDCIYPFRVTGLGADAHAREVLAEERADEGRLAHRVLPQQQHLPARSC